MVDKLISSNNIIAKVIADNNLQEKDMRIADIRAWIGEAIEKIGAVTLLDHRIATLEIKGYLVQLPCDLYKLDQVAYSSDGTDWLPLLRSTSSFSNHAVKQLAKSLMSVPDEAIFQLTKILFNLTDDAAALKKLNENPGIRSTLATLVDNHSVDLRNGFVGIGNYLKYDVKPGYITCRMKDGHLKVSYYAIHTDNEGMPMIPDNQAYQEAIYWYVTMKMFYPDYLKGKIPQYIYHEMKNSWNFYARQAYAEAMLPNVDGLETIKNDWNKLVPELNSHDDFFEHLGEELIIYNWN